MRRIVSVAAAAIGGFVASNAFASYTFQFNREVNTPAGFDRYVLYALGAGQQASENIFAADITLTGAGNNDLKFTAPLDTDGDELPDTVPVTSATVPAATRTRVNNIIFHTIAPGYPSPPNTALAGGDLAAYAAGLKTFQLVGFDGRTGGTGVAADVSQNAGRGAALLAAVVPAGAAMPKVTGQVSGLTGFIQTILLVIEDPINLAPAVVSPAPQTITFGQVVSNGTPFSATIQVTDPNPADVLTLAINSVPPGVSGISISPLAGSTSPATFVVTGTVAYSAVGTTVTIPYTVSDNAINTMNGSLTGSGVIVLNVVPEPASLLALAGAIGVVVHRRR